MPGDGDGKAGDRTWDLTVGGIVGMLGGALGLLSVWGASPEQSIYGEIVAMFGAGPPVAVAYGTVVGVLSIVGGYGVLRARPYGWFILASLVAIFGLPSSLSALETMPFEAFFTLLGVPGGAVWLWCRVPVFKPFGGRLRCEKPSPTERDLLAIFGKSAALIGLMGTVLALARQLVATWWPMPVTWMDGIVNAGIVWVAAICLGLGYAIPSYLRFQKQ